MAKETIEIPYGEGSLSFTPPTGVAVEVLRSKPCRIVPDAAAAMEGALSKPLDSPALRELARGRRTVAVVISDMTRPVPNALLLPRLLREIEAGGVPRDGITILVGTGTHRSAPPDEIRRLVGDEVAECYRIVNHDCRRGNTRVGMIRDPLSNVGIPVLFDRLYVGAQLKVVTGLVEPHIFCGYSGGRKALLPGIAALSTIRRWHGPRLIAHPKSTPGVVDGNIPHALSVEASRLARPHFALNVTIDRARNVTGLFAGDVDSVFDKAVAHVESYVRTKPAEPANVIVTSSAGWPLDATFYQAIKGLVAVLPVMARGGVVVLAAEVREGIGDPGFTALVRRTRDLSVWAAGLPRKKGFSMGQWQLQRMSWIREKGDVFLVSGLSSDDARDCFTRGFGDLQQAIDTALSETGARRMLVVPEGPYVITSAVQSRGR